MGKRAPADACDQMLDSSNTILDIIRQETAPYFDGQKTAEEAARLIHTRT